MDVFSPLVEIAKMIWTPVSQCVKYHRGLEENMEKFQEKLEELNARKTDIESQIRAELFSRKVSREVVDLWLKKVQSFIDDKNLEQEVAKGKFLSRARLGSLVAAKIREVEEYLQKGRFSDGLTVDAVPSRGEMFPTTTLVGETASEIMEEIWTSLLSDDIHKIGVCGMGGSGKSTIMKHIHNWVLEKNDTFDNVHWITVSKATSVISLQDGIASALEFKDIENIEDEAIRAAKLYQQLLKKKRCVLIFDDMWETFNLEDVGIPEPTLGNGCKLIFTTRLFNVCQRMNSRCIKMELLSKDESWNLFLDKVGGDIFMTPEVKATAKLVAKECACLPLAIIAVGTSMKGVADKREWRKALKNLRERTKGLDEMKKAIEQLKYSYTRLNDEKAQRCLLYCALYPEDYNILIHKLITLWIAEEIIEQVGSREEGFDEGHTILNKLENACLLESHKNMAGIKYYVKMHDVIRDMALQIMAAKSMVEAGVQLTELPDKEKWNEDLETVSLIDNNIEEITAHAIPRCSRLKVLLLSENKVLKMIPESFFMHMPSLCVLDLSKTGIEILPNSISTLENLTSLMLRKCYNLYYVPSLATLRKLRGLDLCETKIEQIPQDMEMLANLQYLNIYTEHLKTFPSGILPKLNQLQCLILYCGSETLNIKGEELTGLKKLERLVCQLYDLSGFNTYIRFLQRHHRRLPTSYDLHVRPDKLCTPVYNDNEDKHKKVVGFRIRREGEARTEDPIVLLQNDVEDFRIEDCDEVSSLSDVQLQLLFNLEVLQLVGLKNLCTASSNTPLLLHCTFSRLKTLHIVDCPNIKQLFTSGMVPHLQNLEYMNVWKCEGMEEIVVLAEEEERGSSDSLVKNEQIITEEIVVLAEEEERGSSDSLVKNEQIITITLPKLMTLSLSELPELKSIMCRRGIMVCDSLFAIQIEGCPKLKRLPLYLPLSSNGVPSPPPSLTDILIDSEEWWDSLEWDNPIDKDVLQPFLVVNSQSQDMMSTTSLLNNPDH